MAAVIQFILLIALMIVVQRHTLGFWLLREDNSKGLVGDGVLESDSVSS